MSVNIAIAGAGGRMGVTLIETALNSAEIRLAVALDMPGSATIGQDAGAPLGKMTGVRVSDDINSLAGADCLIDFTRPQGTLAHLDVCVKAGVKMIIGTTGFSDEGKARIGVAARKIPIVFAPNMSVGVNVMLKLVALATKALHAQYDIEIIETHHKMKVDAPSGTALQLGQVAAQAMGKSLDEIAVYDRHGTTGKRQPGSIGFTAIRGGDVIGEHTVMFAGTGERIEISHKSSSRTNYAQGAMRAAVFLTGRKDGLYDMSDVLGLK